MDTLIYYAIMSSSSVNVLASWYVWIWNSLAVFLYWCLIWRYGYKLMFMCPNSLIHAAFPFINIQNMKTFKSNLQNINCCYNSARHNQSLMVYKRTVKSKLNILPVQYGKITESCFGSWTQIIHEQNHPRLNSDQSYCASSG